MHVDTPITVRYAETDMMGVVYHGNYFLYFEDARIDFLKALDFNYYEEVEHAGFMTPIYEVNIKYGAPLRYGEPGFVRTTITRNGPMKTIYRHRVYKAGDDPETDKPLVDASMTIPIVRREDFKPVNIKRTFPELYAKYEEIIEEG